MSFDNRVVITEKASLVKDRINAAQLHTTPVPYFIAEDVLPKSVIADMLAQWPARSFFRPEIPANYVLYFGRDYLDQGSWDYWAWFWHYTGREICAATVARFKPWIEARYGADVPIDAAVISLMESDPEYSGHGAHTHHYHDPGWVGTLLLYLDKGGCGYPGTTLLQGHTSDIYEEAELAANSAKWRTPGVLEDVVTAEYGDSRMFAMFDSPISYHGVKAAPPNAHGHRRIFRVHMGVPYRYVEKIYGTPIQEYRERRKLGKGHEDPVVLGWLKRDIEELRNV